MGAPRPRRKAKAKASDALTARQERFVREYAVDGNGTQAAIRAGFAPKSAHVYASQLLTNPKVYAAAKAAHETALAKIGMTAERVLQKLKDIAEDEGEANRFVTLKALELIGKHHKLFTEKHEGTTETTIFVVDPYAKGAPADG